MFGCTCKSGRDEVEMILPNGDVILLKTRVVKDETDSDPWKVAVRIQAPDNVVINRTSREQYKQFGPADCIVKPQATSKLPGD